MADKIFLVQGDHLVGMERTKYSLEDHLQELLARYPDLMPGEQIDPDQPRLWLLVAREIGVPDEAGASNRWSVDHLFLDQDGIPTLVEAKRSTDPRIRREVVGQLVEYAANAQSYWNVQEIRGLLSENNGDKSEAELLYDALKIDAADVEEFWQKVKSNIQSGHLRLIFVADELPSELKQMIEFLNTQMDPAEVYGIELPQFLGAGDLKTIVPRLIGNTAQASKRKSTAKRLNKQWEEESFFEAMSENTAPSEVTLARDFLDSFKKTGMRISWGKGASVGFFKATVDCEMKNYEIASISTGGNFRIGGASIRKCPAFLQRDICQEVFDQLSSIHGLEPPTSVIQSRIPLMNIDTPEKRIAILAVVDALAKEIRDYSENTISKS